MVRGFPGDGGDLSHFSEHQPASRTLDPAPGFGKRKPSAERWFNRGVALGKWGTLKAVQGGAVVKTIAFTHDNVGPVRVRQFPRVETSSTSSDTSHR